MASRCIMGYKLLASAQRPQPALERQGSRKTQRRSLDSQCLDPRATLKCKTFSGTAQMSFTFGYIWYIGLCLSSSILWYLTALPGMEHCIRCGDLHILLSMEICMECVNGCDYDCNSYTLQTSHWYGFRSNWSTSYDLFFQYIHSVRLYCNFFMEPFLGHESFFDNLLQFTDKQLRQSHFWNCHWEWYNDCHFHVFTHFQFGLVESHKMVSNVPIISNCDGVCFDV